MKAEIIAVGTELLLGQVVNTNATFLSKELADLGIEVYYHTVVGDNPQRLEQLLGEAEDRSDLIVLCGGLGPTDDDLTKDTVAEHIQHALVQDELALTRLHEFFEFSKNKMTENNLRQTLMIEGGIAVQNPTGLAVGTLITENETTYLLLPGPPNELKPMFQQHARPLLEELFPQADQLMSRVLRFYGIGESQLVTELKELIDTQTNPTIAPYAKPNEVTLRLTAKISDETEGKKLLDNLEAKVMNKVGEYFYGYGDENSLVKVTVEALKKAGKTVTAAESLTAGLFQSTLGDISGVSKVFKGGFVTYSAETKARFLDIDPLLLEKEGTVSEACAIAMAEQARKLADADFAVSFTGVAGPDELERQPAGTVWIGLAEKGQPTIAVLQHFNRDRSYIRQSAVMKGLDLIRRAVDKKK
ncbi:competence/damage-inducible protein CinA domain [Enterococcus haemoperoxidus ATCC BAA-382]|uniref:Putative competence-damage inducible protein n=1 Tax=Enterococcus haemoperoxidus ATCC BAA-382 TaxID=1158608 RepID=R2QIH3_9ENTE|nr:competence/damage-inducible protein A [Enterococcus haemoperoxidus]EOH94978.1 competence/damage-inducible protein CinA domain [Enterococcus haemoperoxidus ATCC BAA-382]EOT60377.1 competence/damage-inducible protein CinA [Enterococcus haemoperoxidus ATCC BAA-382]OJG54809.1 competence/damage-inducible protein CinA domain [Enterococcus haemoperoxidus]